MELVKALTTLGLSDKAAQVYLAGLVLKTASVQALAIKTKVKRTSIYSVLEELKEQNLVTETVKGKKRRYVFAHPNQLKAIENERTVILKNSFPKLQKIAAQSPGTPQVSYADSLDSIYKLYETALQTADGETIGISDLNTTKGLTKEWLSKYVKKRNSRGVHAKTILTDSTKYTDWIEESKDVDREIKLISKEYTIPINIEIVGSTVIITSLEGETMGLAIESDKVAKGMRELLEIVWEYTD